MTSDRGSRKRYVPFFSGMMYQATNLTMAQEHFFSVVVEVKNEVLYLLYLSLESE